MNILAIETSCDDTCISIFNGYQFLSNQTASQIKVHQKWGGVYPTLAKREHQKNLVLVLKKALKDAGLLKKGASYTPDIFSALSKELILSKKITTFLKNHQKPDIDILAVTVGPGLDPALWSGINFTKALAIAWKLKIIPVNHIKAHFFAPLYLSESSFPAISLIASGGHTELILSTDLDTHKTIGKTRDDAAGECFDKTARMIGLKYPGGPEIANLATKKTKKTVSLPRPMIHSNDYDFSFSGLKTAVLYSFQKEKNSDKQFKIALAKEIEKAISDVLVKKTFKAVKDFNAKTIVLGGGVSSNKTLRESFKKNIAENINLILPELDFTTDNAKMIAITAFYDFKKGVSPISWEEISPNPNLKI